MAVLDFGSGQPFKQYALEYFELGWFPLPLPPGQKAPPPYGYTGHYPTPTKDVIEDWVATQPDRANVGLRVPDGVIGIDVDAYRGKAGGKSLGLLFERWGELPPTWTLTARADGMSGIRFYRAPAGKHWPGELAPDVQIVQFRHRFAVAYPSIHPDLKRMYRWYPPGAKLDGKSWTSELPNISTLTGVGAA